MTKASVTVGACATLLWAATALATPTPQENCDKARITAWAKYVSCVDAVVAKDAGCSNTRCPASFDEFAAFAKCRHTYFKKWASLQTTSFVGSTSGCAVGLTNRFKDNGDGTVTDNLTTLVWEKKTTDSSVHDQGNTYTWSASGTAADGAAFESFLDGKSCVSSCLHTAVSCTPLPPNCTGLGLNEGQFAGQADWRLPTLAELQSIERDFACTGAGNSSTCQCGASPCIDATFGPTQSNLYWSATSYVPGPDFAWFVSFGNGKFGNFHKTTLYYVRAVRGGL